MISPEEDMQEIRPGRTQAGGLFLLFLAIFSYVLFRVTRGDTTIADIGWGGILGLSLAAIPVAAYGLMLLLGRPYLCWNGEAAVTVGTFGREKRLAFAEFGPVIAWSQPTRHGHTYHLLMRPLKGEKLVGLYLPPIEMSPEKLELLAAAMNQACGLPAGPPDAATVAALQKLQFNSGANILALMLFAPFIAFAIVFLFTL